MVHCGHRVAKRLLTAVRLVFLNERQPQVVVAQKLYRHRHVDLRLLDCREEGRKGLVHLTVKVHKAVFLVGDIVMENVRVSLETRTFVIVVIKPPFYHSVF